MSSHLKIWQASFHKFANHRWAKNTSHESTMFGLPAQGRYFKAKFFLGAFLMLHWCACLFLVVPPFLSIANMAFLKTSLPVPWNRSWLERPCQCMATFTCGDESSSSRSMCLFVKLHMFTSEGDLRLDRLTLLTSLIGDSTPHRYLCFQIPSLFRCRLKLRGDVTSNSITIGSTSPFLPPWAWKWWHHWPRNTARLKRVTGQRQHWFVWLPKLPVITICHFTRTHPDTEKTLHTPFIMAVVNVTLAPPCSVCMSF